MRQQAGVWLKSLREKSGQRVASCVREGGLLHSFISQIESGKGRVPADKLAEADAVDCDRRSHEDTDEVLADPHTHLNSFLGPKMMPIGVPRRF